MKRDEERVKTYGEESVLKGKTNYAQCHVPPLSYGAGWNAHEPSEIGIDDFQSNRSLDETYRTSFLRRLFAHMKRGFYHNGRFATLLDVVNHYNAVKTLGLTEAEKQDLVEYLKSL